MKFGLLKSKIEHVLIESYVEDSLKNDLFIFEELVLKDKNLSKLFYLYDELSSNLGLDENLSNQLIEKSIIIYENSVNKISPKKIKEINMWVDHVKVKNNYEDLDTIFSNNVLNIVEQVLSKKTIVEKLKTPPFEIKKTKIKSIESLINEANKKTSKIFSNVDESEKIKIKKLWSSNESVLKNQYDILKEISLVKLSKLQNNEKENETKKTINETIEKIKNDSFSKYNFIKLKSLNESI